MKRLVVLLSILSLTACTEYWWTRGQAPGPDVLLNRAQERLAENIKTNPQKRNEVASIASSIESSLLAAVNAKSTSDRSKSIQNSINSFEQLEGKLAVTSRAPYGELFGQLRTISKSQDVDNDALQLFAARALFFLASELEVPAPSFGA